MSTSPVVIVGSHRSGTSITTQLLDRAGLFVGNDLEAHHESRSFIRINTWVMRECGGAWDQPEPVRNALAEPKNRRAFARYISEVLNSRYIASYLGWWEWLRYGGPSAAPFSWGWKDPRSTIVLPVWLEIFPEARIIHVKRHGVDVANSLHVRQADRRSEEALRERTKCLKDDLTWFFGSPLQDHTRLPGSHRCSELETSFGLWEAYEATAERFVTEADVPVKRIRYEELVEKPVPILRELADFADVDLGHEQIEQVVQEVNEDRARAYRRDENLKEFAEDLEDRLARFGYSA